MGINRLVCGALLCGLCLSACGPPPRETASIPEPQPAQWEEALADIHEKNIILRHDSPKTSTLQKGAEAFQASLETYSGGRWRVEIFPQGTLGDDSDTEYALQYGTVTIHLGDPLYSTLHCLAFTALSGDLEAYRALLESAPVREQINGECERNGARFLGVVSSGYAYLTANRPISTLDSFRGLRVAAPTSDHKVFWQALGGIPVNCRGEQVYTALQQDMVDAQEAPFPDRERYTQLSDYQSHILRLDHFIHSKAAYINGNFYDNLTADEKEILLLAVEDTRALLETENEAHRERMLRELTGKGMLLLEPSSQLKQDVAAAVRRPLLDLLEQKYGRDLVAALYPQYVVS